MGVMLELVRRRTVNSVICMDGRFDSVYSHKYNSACAFDVMSSDESKVNLGNKVQENYITLASDA